jgi:hypothetical protein
MKKAFSVALASALLSSTFIAPSQAAEQWVMTVDNVSLGMKGVSAHVEKIGDKDRVWRSFGPQGTIASDCNDAGICTDVTLTGSYGNDFTVLTLKDGTKRGYFITIDGDYRQVFSAPCNDSGCTSLGSRTATSSDMKIPRDQKAWGVPDPVLLPDGRVRIYIVEMPVMGHCREKIATYISTDGISFTKEPGWRLENGYVDTEILRAKDGDWVMILADINCTFSGRQELFVSTSKDGLTWAAPQMLTGAGLGGLDPTGYESSPGVFRVYFTQESKMGAGDFTLKRGTLKLTTVADTKTSEPAKKTIICVKGKKSKEVSGINPKCPKGYKKK